MTKCIICGENSYEENFCLNHEQEGFHICEDCGKPVKNSKYSLTIGGLVCEECQPNHELEC